MFFRIFYNFIRVFLRKSKSYKDCSFYGLFVLAELDFFANFSYFFFILISLGKYLC